MIIKKTTGKFSYVTYCVVDKEEYTNYIYSLDIVELLKHMSEGEFICIFDVEARKDFNYLYSDDITPDLFYEYIIKQPISLIECVLAFTKNPIFNYPMVEHMYINFYKNITTQLELILQYHKFNETLQVDSHKVEKIIKI